MKTLHKIISALIACSIMLPTAAMAASYDDNRISLFDGGSDEATIEISENEKNLVNYIIDNIKNLETDIDISEFNIDITRLNYLFQNCINKCIQDDHPELFYVRYANLDTENSSTSSLKYTYDCTQDDVDAAFELIDSEVQNITSLINDNMSDYEKVLLVHDYIVNNYEYDTRLFSETERGQENRWLDEMVKEKRGVCQGYTHLFKYVMDKIGIECQSVSATELQHIWNKVKINGEWYNIDLTFDDPVLEYRNLSLQLPFQPYHSFFLLTDDEIKQIDETQHAYWDTLCWDGTSSTVSAQTSYENNIVRSINGPIVFGNDSFYCINSVFDENSRKISVCSINFENNNLDDVYVFDKDDLWYAYGAKKQFYQAAMCNLVSFKGDVYFNTPSKVYRLNSDDEGATEVYSYAKKNPDKVDVSNTYLYGLIEKDDILYAEYATAFQKLDDGGNIVSMPEEYIQVVPEKLPCESSIKMNSDGNIVVTLDIPESLKDEAEFFIAQFDKNGLLIGCVDSEVSNNTVTFTADENTSAIKTFIWSKSNAPLSYTSILTLPSTPSDN